jgi:hypothetical protein
MNTDKIKDGMEREHRLIQTKWGVRYSLFITYEWDTDEHG